MNNGRITISVPNGTTQEEIREIREQFKKDQTYNNYKLNILISGCNDIKTVLTEFLRNKTF